MLRWVALCLWAAPAAADVVEARYSGPTTRYDHGVLGDAVEWTVLTARLADGREVSARWEAPLVFEDVAPRVVDLDGDGASEIVVVETHADLGARLAIWGVEGDRLVPRVSTDFIGQTHRWLAPAGWGDLDGDGRGEVAFVDRPHLTKVLRVFRYTGDALIPVGEVQGVTNHRIGDPQISGGMRDCGSGTEMVLLSGDWSRVVAVRGSDLAVRDLGPNGPGAVKAALGC